MIRFAADEGFNNDVVRALRRALPEVNILGAREAGLAVLEKRLSAHSFLVGDAFSVADI